MNLYIYTLVLGQRKLLYLYKVQTKPHSYSVMHTVVDYDVAKGNYLLPCTVLTVLKGALDCFHLAHGKEILYYRVDFVNICTDILIYLYL